MAVLTPHVSRWFFGELLEAVEMVLREAGLDLVLYPINSLEDRRQFFERLPLRRNVDGILIFALTIDTYERSRLKLANVATVAAGGQIGPYPRVAIDDAQASRQAVEHLLDLGHRRVAMISAIPALSPASPTPVGRNRGYFAAMSAAGLGLEPDLVVTGPWTGEAGAAAMGRLLALGEPPTAVYAHSDEVALGAIRTVRRAGLRVPEDMSVVGIDDHPLAALTDLTTIRQPVVEQGSRAARMLLQAIDGSLAEDNVLLPTQLVVRRSTAPLS